MKSFSFWLQAISIIELLRRFNMFYADQLGCIKDFLFN